MGRTDTKDIAALLAATDTQGNVDPVVFEAQRLVLRNEQAGNLDSDGLMRAVHESPLYGTPDQERLIRTISNTLDNPADRANFSKAMGKSYLLSEAEQDLAAAYDWTKGKIVQADQAASDSMAAAQRWARSVQNDPKHGLFMHGIAAGASAAVGDAQTRYGQAKGALSDAAGAVTGAVDLGKMAYRFSTDENYRNALINVAKAYAGEVEKDPAKPAKDLYHSGKEALNKWEAGLNRAKAEGREQEYLGHAQGVACMEILLAVVPETKAGKFGEVARILDHAPIRSTEEAAEVLTKVAALQREGGDAARGAEEIMRATVRDARAHGNLPMVLEAARKTDTVNGLLRSGELTPKELGEVAKLDHTVFKSATSTSAKDGVTFTEAMDASTKGVDLAKLNTKQLGDVGEAIHTYDMAKAGYTDIIAIKNKSGHGIDFVGRNPKGELEFHEVKTSAAGKAAAQKGDPDEFVGRRLQRAIDAQKHWAEKNTLPGLSDTARSLQKEIGEGKINAKWVQINLSHTPGTPKLHVEKTIEDWTKALPKHARLENPRPVSSPIIGDAKPLSVPKDMRDPDHPGHKAFGIALNEVRAMEATRGIPSGPHSERLAAGVAVAAEYAKVSIDRIELRGNQVVAVSRPGGFDEPVKTTAVSTDFATGRSVGEHSAEWLKARSPYYGEGPIAERTPEQARLLNQLSPNDQALFAKIRENLPPQINDDKVAEAALQARRAGIDSPEKLALVAISGDQLYMRSTQIGRSETVTLSQPAPPMQEMVNQTRDLNQQQAQQQLTQQQLNQNGPRGPAMG